MEDLNTFVIVPGAPFFIVGVGNLRQKVLDACENRLWLVADQRRFFRGQVGHSFQREQALLRHCHLWLRKRPNLIHGRTLRGRFPILVNGTLFPRQRDEISYRLVDFGAYPFDLHPPLHRFLLSPLVQHRLNQPHISSRVPHNFLNIRRLIFHPRNRIYLRPNRIPLRRKTPLRHQLTQQFLSKYFGRPFRVLADQRPKTRL